MQNKFSKIQIPGGMLELRFDRYITANMLKINTGSTGGELQFSLAGLIMHFEFVRTGKHRGSHIRGRVQDLRPERFECESLRKHSEHPEQFERQFKQRCFSYHESDTDIDVYYMTMTSFNHIRPKLRADPQPYFTLEAV